MEKMEPGYGNSDGGGGGVENDYNGDTGIPE